MTWRMTMSLQFRLSLWIALLIVAVSVAAGWMSFSAAFDEAHELQDEQLKQVSALVFADGLPSAGYYHVDEDDPNAKVFIFRLGKQPQIPGSQPQVIELPGDLAKGLQTVSVGDSEWRILVRALPSGERIALGQSTVVRDVIARDGALRTVLPLVGLVPLLIFLVGFVIRQTLKPVMRLSSELDQKGEGNFVPLPADGIPNEILPFVASINRLLSRLALSMAQQRRFVADAAHELRSPITALTLQAENLERAEMSAEARQRLTPLKSGLARARSLVEQLLSLARHQTDQAATTEVVALDRIVREAIEELYPLAEARRIDLGIEREEPIRARGATLDFFTLARNAIDNAIRYAPLDGKVDVSLFVDGDRMVFRVDDNGPGIAETELARVFDPFYRIVDSGSTGSGLGLSIVRDIAARLGGAVTLTNIDTAGRTGLRFQYSQSLAG